MTFGEKGYLPLGNRGIDERVIPITESTSESTSKITTKTSSSSSSKEDDEENLLQAINLFLEANGSISKLQKKSIEKLVNTYTLDFVLKAIQVTADKAKTFNMDYLKKVLKSYAKNGHKTIEDIENAENIKNTNKKTSIQPECNKEDYYNNAADMFDKLASGQDIE